MIINKNTSITYLGHATVIIETPGGKRILIDPWTEGNPACPENYKPFAALGRIDLVLLTHIHNDHAGDAVASLKHNTEAFVICVPEAAAWLASKGVANIYSMNIGGSFRPAGASIRISMTQAFHTSSFTEEDGTVVNGGNPVGFIVELENGFSIYAAGDTSVFGDMALIKKLHSPDLALLPIGDHYTMGPHGAALAAELLGIDFVIPIHYATFPVLVGTPAELVENLGENSKVKVLEMKPGETIR